MFNTAHFHPLIVHFPVALITAGFFAETLSLFVKNKKFFSSAGFYLMILGALSAIAAWTTGHLFTAEPTQGAIVSMFEKHETGALITMILMVIGSIFRVWLVMKKKEETPLKWIVFAIYFLAFVSVTYTGFMGGSMVYDYMMSL